MLQSETVTQQMMIIMTWSRLIIVPSLMERMHCSKNGGLDLRSMPSLMVSMRQSVRTVWRLICQHHQVSLH